MSNNPLIIAAELNKVYHKDSVDIEVLKDISFTIDEGEFVVVKGPSGAGKSTLLNILGALDVPTSGSLEVAGQNIIGMPENAQAAFRNQFVGFVFQFHHLLVEFTALENLFIPSMIGGTPIEDLREKATALLEQVGLGHRINHKPRELSGGEQQRVAIARALMNSPHLILADEPTGNLDTKTSDKVFSLLKELNESNNQTLIVATHNEQLSEMATRIIELVDGVIVNNYVTP